MGAVDDRLVELGLVVLTDDDRVVIPSLADAISYLVLREARTAAESASTHTNWWLPSEKEVTLVGTRITATAWLG